MSGKAGRNRHLEAALAQVTDAVITTGLCDQITYMNAIAEILTGKSRQDAVGQLLTTVLSIVDAATGRAIGEAVDAAKRTDASATLPRNAVLLGGAADYHRVQRIGNARRPRYG